MGVVTRGVLGPVSCAIVAVAVDGVEYVAADDATDAAAENTAVVTADAATDVASDDEGDVTIIAGIVDESAAAEFKGFLDVIRDS